MLMQWVKRNSDVVKGIEYFSCVDMAFDNSKWCANNIVLPAFAPYENGVSRILKRKSSHGRDLNFMRSLLYLRARQRQTENFSMNSWKK